MSYNHIEYMEAIATILKDIAHTSDELRFFKSTSLASMDGLLAHIGVAKLPALIAEDQSDSGFIDNTSNNILDRAFYSFYVLYPASPGDDSKIFEARDNAKATAKKIISKMRKDAAEWNYGLKDLEVSSFRFMGIGPLGDCGYGVMVSFTIIEDSDTDYNDDDWIS